MYQVGNVDNFSRLAISHLNVRKYKTLAHLKTRSLFFAEICLNNPWSNRGPPTKLNCLNIVKQALAFNKFLFTQCQCILCHQPGDGGLCNYCAPLLSQEALTHKRKILHLQNHHIYLYSINHYSGYTRKLLFMFKYNKNHLAGQALSAYFTLAFQRQRTLDDVDVMIPVPSHRFRFLYRGFNHADIFAKNLAKTQHCRLAQRALYRKKYTKPQAQSDYEARQQQLKHVFDQRKTIHASHALVIDDVITTGATIKALIHTLLSHPDNAIHKISVLTLCRT